MELAYVRDQRRIGLQLLVRCGGAAKLGADACTRDVYENVTGLTTD